MKYIRRRLQNYIKNIIASIRINQLIFASKSNEEIIDFINKYKKLIYSACSKMGLPRIDWDTVLNDIAILYFNDKIQFDSSYGDSSALIYTIAKRKCSDIMKKKKELLLGDIIEQSSSPHDDSKNDNNQPEDVFDKNVEDQMQNNIDKEDLLKKKEILCEALKRLTLTMINTPNFKEKMSFFIRRLIKDEKVEKLADIYGFQSATAGSVFFTKNNEIFQEILQEVSKETKEDRLKETNISIDFLMPFVNELFPDKDSFENTSARNESSFEEDRDVILEALKRLYAWHSGFCQDSSITRMKIKMFIDRYFHKKSPSDISEKTKMNYHDVFDTIAVFKKRFMKILQEMKEENKTSHVETTPVPEDVSSSLEKWLRNEDEEAKSIKQESISPDSITPEKKMIVEALRRVVALRSSLKSRPRVEMFFRIFIYGEDPSNVFSQSIKTKPHIMMYLLRKEYLTLFNEKLKEVKNEQKDHGKIAFTSTDMSFLEPYLTWFLQGRPVKKEEGEFSFRQMKTDEWSLKIEALRRLFKMKDNNYQRNYLEETMRAFVRRVLLNESLQQISEDMGINKKNLVPRINRMLSMFNDILKSIYKEKEENRLEFTTGVNIDFLKDLLKPNHMTPKTDSQFGEKQLKENQVKEIFRRVKHKLLNYSGFQEKSSLEIFIRKKLFHEQTDQLAKEYNVASQSITARVRRLTPVFEEVVKEVLSEGKDLILTNTDIFPIHMSIARILKDESVLNSLFSLGSQQS